MASANRWLVANGAGSDRFPAATPSSPAVGALGPMRACFSAPPRTRTALVAFGRYYAGLVVLLHSLFHHNAAEPDCGGLLVLWHPVLTPRPGAFVLYVRATRTNLSCVLYEPGAQGSLPR